MASCDDHTILSLHKSNLSYIEPIGKGSFGSVFKVLLKTSDGEKKEAAAKVIGSCKQSNDELMFMSKLKHKNIITFYGFIREKTELTIVTELASKGDLRSYLQKSNTQLPDDLVRKWVREAAEGIEYLHQQRTVHKDIKSSNLLITSDDTLKLCDFGTVGVLDEDVVATSHREGTARWMAPEVIEKELRSAKSDVFSYGIVIWETCSREIPFAELKTNDKIMDAIVKGKRPKMQDGFPILFRKIMQSCWKQDHVERPTMEEVLDMLNNDQDQILTEDIEDEEEPDRYEYFENFTTSIQSSTRKIIEQGETGKNLMQQAERVMQNFHRLQTTKAKTSKDDVDRIHATDEKPTNRRTKLEAKHAEMIAEKDKMRHEIKKSKEALTDPGCDKVLEMAAVQVGMFAVQEAEKMFQACYKSEDWNDEDLQSFTRMSTMHANIPDVIQEDVKGQVKICNQAETTCNVFQLSFIPSESTLLEWKGILEQTEQNQGVYRYIDTEVGFISLETIKKLLTIHRALDIKIQVKQDLTWFFAPPLKPTLVEKRPGSLTAFQNLVFHSKCDEMLEGYGMGSEELAKVCCDHVLSLPIIQWFLNRLNQMQSEVFCICPQEQDATQQALCDLLEEGGREPTALLFIFNVKKNGNKVTLRDASEPGSHFTLCHVNTLTGTVLYADSLGWSIPQEIEENVKFYYQCIYEHGMPEWTVCYCHEPSSVSDDNTHKCSHQCATYYPLQICHTICGPVVIIVASLACLDHNIFLFLTTRQRYSNYPFIDCLRNPSDFSKYLRHVLGVWIGDRMIDLDYVTPKNFRKYQLVANFDPNIVADLHLAPFHPFIVPVPGLIDVLIPESTEITKHDTDTGLIQNDRTVSDLHWSGSGSGVLDEESVRSCSRIEVTRFQLPRIEDVHEDKGRLVTNEDQTHPPKITNVFQQSMIPDKKTLCALQKGMENMVSTSGTNCPPYVEIGEERYDQTGLDNSLKLHDLIQIQMDVHDEMKWFSSYQQIPIATTNLPSLDSITKFRHLIHNNEDSEMLPDYQMNTRDLAMLCCNRQLCRNHIEWVVKELNSMQSRAICVYRGTRNSSPQSQFGVLSDKSAASMVMVFNVYKSDDEVKFSDENVPGCHFTICFVDVESKKILYGDSHGWSAPEDCNRAVSAEYERAFGSPLPSMEVVLCHDTTFNASNGDHICSPICATYYPLHTCSTLDGVVCCIMMAIACLAPEYLKFLTVRQYNKILTGSLGFHMQHPTLHANYLRRVLVALFAEKRFDIQHLVPEGFSTYKQLAVHGT